MIKKLIIFHGLGKKSADEWYQTLARTAENMGYKSSIPDLPSSAKPNLELTYRMTTKDYQLNSNTTLVGHSSGAVLILGILQKLPPNIVIDKVILIAGFVDPFLTDQLHSYVPRKDYTALFPQTWEWKKIKKSAKSFVIIYSSNDPYVQSRHALELHTHLGGQIVKIPNAGHFGISTGGEKFKKFEKLLDYLQ